MNEKQLLTVLALCISTVIACAAKQPPSIDRSASEPVKYIGSDQPDKRFYHGLLRQAVGVHRYQALRANRTNPPERGFVGWTYNHGPNLAYWNGRFFLHYLSNPNETNIRYPFYMESPDSGFVKACEALLSDKLVPLTVSRGIRGIKKQQKVIPPAAGPAASMPAPNGPVSPAISKLSGPGPKGKNPL